MPAISSTDQSSRPAGTSIASGSFDEASPVPATALNHLEMWPKYPSWTMRSLWWPCARSKISCVRSQAGGAQPSPQELNGTTQVDVQGGDEEDAVEVVGAEETGEQEQAATTRLGKRVFFAKNLRPGKSETWSRRQSTR